MHGKYYLLFAQPDISDSGPFDWWYIWDKYGEDIWIGNDRAIQSFLSNQKKIRKTKKN